MLILIVIIVIIIIIIKRRHEPLIYMYKFPAGLYFTNN